MKKLFTVIDRQVKFTLTVVVLPVAGFRHCRRPGRPKQARKEAAEAVGIACQMTY